MHKLNQVFFLEESIPLCQLAEFSLKEDGVKCFTHPNPEDCLYLIEDLKPDIIWLSWSLIKDKLADLKQKFLASDVARDIPLVLLAKEGEVSQEVFKTFFIKGQINKPLSSVHLKERLEAFLNTYQ